jgi:hypothetical protein
MFQDTIEISGRIPSPEPVFIFAIPPRNEWRVVKARWVANEALSFGAAHDASMNACGVHLETVHDPPETPPDLNLAFAKTCWPLRLVVQVVVRAHPMVEAEVLVRHAVIPRLGSKKRQISIGADLVDAWAFEIQRDEPNGLSKVVLGEKRALDGRDIVAEKGTTSDVLGAESAHTHETHVIRGVCGKRAISPANPYLALAEEWESMVQSVTIYGHGIHYCDGTYMGWMLSR